MALSYSNAVALLKAAINFLEKTEGYGRNTYVGLYTTLGAANLGDYPNLVSSAAARHRGLLAGTISAVRVRALLTPPLIEIMAAIGSPERSYEGMLFRWREYMLSLGTVDKVVSRSFSRGTMTAGSNSGNGTINRLLVDEDGYPLEGSFPNETKTFECVYDQNTVEKHAEVFQVRGTKAEYDGLKVIGTGMKRELPPCFTTRDSQAYVANPAFSQFSGTVPTAGVETTPTTTTSVTGWTLGNTAGARVSIDQCYRSLVGETAKYSVRFTADNSLSQVLSDIRRARLGTKNPLYDHWAVYRESNCDGTLTAALGASSVAISMASLNNAAWNIVKLGTTAGVLDKRCYHKNFKSNALALSLTLAGRTTGSIYVGDKVCRPLVPLDGIYVGPVGGSTPFLLRDSFACADAEYATIRGIINYWCCFRSGLNDGGGMLGYLFSLPSAENIPTAAATLAQSATGGLITAGTHVIAVSFVDVNGVESGPSAISNSINFDGAHKADASAVPTGPTGATASRKLYMSKAGTTTPLYDTGASIADNTTTTKSAFGVADGSLTVVSVAGVTIADPM